ncbi:MAG: C1 family peptidase [Candidatus Omnitrophota bacterium]
MKVKKCYGWVPDIPDQRDYLYRAIRPAARLPKKTDIRNYCSLVEDQGKLGSCTANALAGNLEFLDNRIDALYEDVSRLFIYYNERALEGTIDFDSGASLRNGIKTLRKTGYCREDIWPYVIEKFDRRPSGKCYEEARKHRIEAYHRIYTLNEMLSCLAEGYPFVFGFAVYESFESQRVARTGVVNMPRKGERMIGGHAVMAAGYDQAKGRLLVRNSWGDGWGMDGYFTMPFDYAQTLAADFWTIRK